MPINVTLKPHVDYSKLILYVSDIHSIGGVLYTFLLALFFIIWYNIIVSYGLEQYI